MFAQARTSTFLATTKAKESKKFYLKVLKLPLIDDTPFSIAFRLKGAELRISKVKELTPQPWTVLDWQVEDIEKAMSVLKKRGAKFEFFEGMGMTEDNIWSPPAGGVRIAWFKDPDGNMLSISQRN